MKKVPRYYNSSDRVYIIRDRQNKFEAKMTLNFSEDIPINILKWFNKITGARVFGFFIAEGRSEAKHIARNKYLYENGKNYWVMGAEIGREAAEELVKKTLKQFKDEKFLTSKLPGYENFFFISGGQELTTDDENGIEVEGKFSARKLATAFAKYNKKRAVNRVLVSRFIQGIAA